MNSQKLTKVDEFLVELTQLDSIKHELEKSSSADDLERLIKQSNETISKLRQSLFVIQYWITRNEYKNFERKLFELGNYFKNFNKSTNERKSATYSSKKFEYDEQPLIDSFNMDDNIQDKEIKNNYQSQLSMVQSQAKSFQVNQNIMSQSIINFDKSILKGSRSKSLSAVKIQKRLSLKKNFKEPVVLFTEGRPRSKSIANSSHFENDDDIDEILYKSQRETQRKPCSQFIVPDTQTIETQITEDLVNETTGAKYSFLRINLIKDEEFIPLSKYQQNFWNGLSDGSIDLKKEFKNDFDF